MGLVSLPPHLRAVVLKNMNTQNVTPWFSGAQKPVRTGYYDARTAAGETRAYFSCDSQTWSVDASQGTTILVSEWRGLASEPR